jgi:60kDa lysophospholipase
MLSTPGAAPAGVKVAEMRSPELESLILVIMTGGTICMKRSPDGLIPERGFLENAMAPRQEFNDGIDHHPTDVRTNNEDPPKKLRTLRTPLSAHGKRIR